ncbi:hypothetical protein F2Q70_00010888 [Brassica cretica]|uniref:Uncharacterized protein n=1 Tax=Brassica cretica TaxID=69181 RepID=A0A8S9LTQ6_BRACR|nr:hypothetical protein F2Q70_00010888 [Brassica cretica]
MRAGSSSRAFFPRQTVEAALSSCARVGDSACSNPRDSIDWLSSTTRLREPASRRRLTSSSSCVRVRDPAPLIPRGGFSWHGYAGRRHRSQPARLYPRWSVETFTSCARVARPALFFPRQTVEAALSSCARVGDSVCSNPRDSIYWLSSTTRVREPASLHPASRCRLASSSSCARVHDPAPLIPRGGSSGLATRFSIDPLVNAFIRASWQAYYMRPWKSWRSVPDKRRDSRWQTFVTVETGEPPSYTDLVRKTHTKKDGTFGDYRAEELVIQAEMDATQVSNTNSDGSPQSPSATSAPSRILLNQAYLKNAKGKRGHVYGLGSAQYREHAPSARVPASLARNLELELRTVETGEPPSYTDLFRRTHTKKNWTFGDYRAEELVTQAEMEATQVSYTNSDGSPQSPSATSAPSLILLNQAYQKNAKGKRGHVYGLGSAQYREHAPSARVPASLARNLELELRVSGLETSLQSVTADVSAVKADVRAVKEDVATMKEDFAAIRAAITELIQSLRPQANPQQQPPFTQAQDPSTQA